MDRKTFLKWGSATAAGVAGVPLTSLIGKESEKLALGFDNFSIRAMEWDATQLIDYAAAQKVDILLMSDLDVYQSFDEGYLKEVGAHAKSSGITLHAGTGSICGKAKRFDEKHGTDVEHMQLTLKVANLIGADVARCYQGNSGDRKLPGGLAPLMDRTVEVCKASEAMAKDLGVKIAIENHSGDLTAIQLKEIIERAGPDYVGATIDAGNAAFTFEDPIENLRILGPYVLSSGIRDTAMWEEDDKIGVWWKPMGEGAVDWEAYFALWSELCPKAPVVLEIISQWGKKLPRKSDQPFWQHYQDIRDVDYAAFLKRAKGGTKPPEPVEERFTKEFMQQELEQSLAYCRQIGLGQRNS